MNRFTVEIGIAGDGWGRLAETRAVELLYRYAANDATILVDLDPDEVVRQLEERSAIAA